MNVKLVKTNIFDCAFFLFLETAMKLENIQQTIKL